MTTDISEEAEAQLCTVPEAQDRLKIGRTRLYALLAEGQLESVRIGRSRRIPLASIRRFIADLRDQTGAIGAR
jgi:excisionase family DNA binding protein